MNSCRLVPALIILLITAASAATPARPRSKPRQRAPRTQHQPPILQRATGSRAERYAALSADACLEELGNRHVPFERESPQPGVEIPIRLTGQVGGVLYRTDYPDRERSTVPWEVFDCRLVLSLDDFSRILRDHAIGEVRIFSAWRPPAKAWPKDQRARRHQGALAVDVREFRKDTGEVLNVLTHFHGKVGVSQCASGAPVPNPDSPEARELHALVCAAAEARVFNSILTPNYNVAHKNHFHLELTPDVDWFMLR